ncbi:hypothetical protein V6N11_021492 [Hibiscus sabdariffa]|uniref:Uncharacterized protein n=1 Tax=Hibiscus sabdariffa TaxID=183260 RepID=A0ABR1ZUW0_9ROSI
MREVKKSQKQSSNLLKVVEEESRNITCSDGSFPLPIKSWCQHFKSQSIRVSHCLFNSFTTMEPVDIEMAVSQQQSADPLLFARSYQIEALEKALKQNTIAYLETGSGKTLIAIMLLRSYAYLIRKPSPFFAVFLVPQVLLVKQQADAVEMHTDLKVGKYCGEMGVDFWDGAKWKQEIEKYEVLVMTPQILLNGLRHSFFKMNMIKVLVMDECHHAKRKHPYASIMINCILVTRWGNELEKLLEFYHRQLEDGVSNLPRIFGMTASPINTKGANSADGYWQKIHELETIMHSKVYTCASESVLSQFIPFSTPKFKYYQHMGIPNDLYARIEKELNLLKVKDTDGRCTAFQHEHSLDNLDLEASAALSTRKKISKTHSTLMYCLDELGVWLALKAAEYLSCYENEFLLWEKLDACGDRIVRSFSSDAFHAIQTCIPSGPDWGIANDVKASVDAGFLTSKVLCLIESLSEYRVLKDIRCIIFVERVMTAIVLESLFSELFPKHSSWKSKYVAGNSSGLQNQTRKKQNDCHVNIIFATSILEEVLDVQACNLIIRFDPSSNICSFIQSRGRARMENSDYLLMVKSEDLKTQSRLKGTGACMTLSSSVGLLSFYCSRLPSDGYFKPSPRFLIDKQMGIAPSIYPRVPLFNLSDYNLVPDIVVEEDDVEETGKEPYNDDQPIFFPPELVTQGLQESLTKYYYYLMELKQNFDYEFPVHNIMLLLRSQLEMDEKSVGIELEVDRGTLTVNMEYIGPISLNSDQVNLCRRFQIALFRVRMDRKAENLTEVLCDLTSGNSDIDYLVLPSNYAGQNPAIDWLSVSSVLFSYQKGWNYHKNCNAGMIQTKSGLLCTCMIQTSLVSTPHNGHVYITNGFLNHLNANSLLSLRDGSEMTYKEYYGQRYESSNAFVELPPELCDVLMSPISISTFYSFTFVPSIMQRIESLLLATSLKKMHLDHAMQNVAIPTMKVLEAITTKKCLESFHLESLETLGNSFLKYTVCQELFKRHQNHHEGLLSIKKDKIISNTNLCTLGCDKKLSGFICDEPFDPKNWMIPGCSGIYTFNEETLCVDFTNILYERQFKVQAEELVNVRYLESLLNHSFQDSSLLVEALTHGSYMLPEIPGCYQRLEFLGDSILDYLITLHFCYKYPGISPGLLNDLRSASVNNNCYALSAVKSKLHKFILHGSQKLYKDIKETVKSFRESLLEYTFGWESEKSFPKVLGDVIESLAGAIFVDLGYNKKVEHYEQRKPAVSLDNGVYSITIEVEANGRVFKHTSTASDEKMAKELASKEVLKSLKEANFSL